MLSAVADQSADDGGVGACDCSSRTCRHVLAHLNARLGSSVPLRDFVTCRDLSRWSHPCPPRRPRLPSRRPRSRRPQRSRRQRQPTTAGTREEAARRPRDRPRCRRCTRPRRRQSLPARRPVLVLRHHREPHDHDSRRDRPRRHVRDGLRRLLRRRPARWSKRRSAGSSTAPTSARRSTSGTRSSMPRTKRSPVYRRLSSSTRSDDVSEVVACRRRACDS